VLPEAVTAAELLTTVGALGRLVVSVEKKVVMSELFLVKDNSKAGRWEMLYTCSWSRFVYESEAYLTMTY
jgi:hypothetical protein